MYREQLVVVVLLCMVLGMVFVPGCGGKQPKDANTVVANRIVTIEDRIEDHIDDEQLQAHLLLLVLENKFNYFKIQRNFMNLQRELRDHPEYTRPQMEEQLSQARQKRQVIFYEVAATRMEMRRLLSEEQWNLIFHIEINKKEGGES